MPGAAVLRTVLFAFPFAFAQELDARAIDQQIECLRAGVVAQLHLLAASENSLPRPRLPLGATQPHRQGVACFERRVVLRPVRRALARARFLGFTQPSTLPAAAGGFMQQSPKQGQGQYSF